MRYCYIGGCIREGPFYAWGYFIVAQNAATKIVAVVVYVLCHLSFFFGPQKREFVLDLHFYHRCPQAKQHTTTKSKQLFGQRVKGVYSGTVDLLERFIDTWLVGMV